MPSRVSNTAISLRSGNCATSHRPSCRAVSSRLWFSWRYSMCGAASNTSAAATGDSWLPSAPASRTLGRASASANSAITAARKSSNSNCRNCSLRRLASARIWMNLSAGNSIRVGLRRMIRCSTIGTAISRVPARRERLTKVMLGARGEGRGVRGQDAGSWARMARTWLQGLTWVTRVVYDPFRRRRQQARRLRRAGEELRRLLYRFLLAEGRLRAFSLRRASALGTTQQEPSPAGAP